MTEPARPAARRASICCEVVPVDSLSARERRELFGVITGHFDGVSEAEFLADLTEKQTIILLRDEASRAIRGFSTMMLIEASIDGQRRAAVYAGDTVMEPDLWGHSTWVYAWARRGFIMATESGADRPHLLLLTSTHRSYRFMAGFFHEYFPRADRPTPPETRTLIDAFIQRRFPTEYDPARGVVSLREPRPVRAGRQDPMALDDADDIRFFRALNPGCGRGDYLVCAAEFTWDNLTPLGRRVVSEIS